MWTDNETSLDYLNFGSVAKTVAEIIEQANSRPVSIGISGAWGMGKSSMIKLVETELLNIQDSEKKYLFIEFNAWLYQGYDDARAALIEVVASRLYEETIKRENYTDKAQKILKRVNWFRAVKVLGSAAVSMAFGIPPVSLTADAIAAGKNLLAGNISQVDLDTGSKLAKAIKDETTQLVKPQEFFSPPKEIQALRNELEDLLSVMEVTLVVLIDDLDRCLPETTISTLEAIRLLLFLKNTAFVIAADDHMIKHAVKKHFLGVEDELVTNYFDKLIQVPIRVPPLGTQEVRAYMMLLHIENSSVPQTQKDKIRTEICCQLASSWQGKRVDRKFINSLMPENEMPPGLSYRLNSADRLASIMTTSVGIQGNPRIIKRFLNALSIRMSMAKSQSVNVDEAVLAKILLFERCGNPKAYLELIKAVSENENGIPLFLAKWEKESENESGPKLTANWEESFTKEWLKLPPKLGDTDLRGALYVSREHSAIITPEDRLSPEAVNLLEGLLEHPDMASSFKAQLSAIHRSEISVLMDRVITKAQREQEWGTPPILSAAITLAQLSNTESQKIADFLKDRPAVQIKPNIVPKIFDEAWAKSVFDFWLADPDIAGPIKKAIQTRR